MRTISANPSAQYASFPNESDFSPEHLSLLKQYAVVFYSDTVLEIDMRDHREVDAQFPVQIREVGALRLEARQSLPDTATFDECNRAYLELYLKTFHPEVDLADISSRTLICLFNVKRIRTVWDVLTAH